METITLRGLDQAVEAQPPVGQHAIGKVVTLQGQVQTTAADGTVRTLSPNSVIFANDHVITGRDGSISLFTANNSPTQLDIGHMTETALDEDVYAPVTMITPADVTAEVVGLQKSLLRDDDPPEMEAPAAGAGAGGVGDAHPTVSFSLTANEVTPSSGEETTTGLQYSAIETIQSNPEPSEPQPGPGPEIILNAIDNVAAATEKIDVSSSSRIVTETLATDTANIRLNLQNADGSNERYYDSNNSPLKMTIPDITQEGRLIITFDGSTLGSQQELGFDIFGKDGFRAGTVTLRGSNTSTVSTKGLGEGPYTLMLVYARLLNLNNNFTISNVHVALTYTEITDTYTYTYESSGNVISDLILGSAGEDSLYAQGIDHLIDQDGNEQPLSPKAYVSEWTFTNPYLGSPVSIMFGNRDNGEKMYNDAEGNFTIIFGADGSYTFQLTGSESMSSDNLGIRYTVNDGELSDTATLYIRSAEHMILGDDYDNILYGADGNDIIYGGAGNNIIYGYSGNNTLIGGSGKDTFVIADKSNNLIMDFSKAGSDVLDISDVFDSSVDYLEVVNDGGKVKLLIWDRDNNVKASVTFDNFNYSDYAFDGTAADVDLLKTLIGVSE